jgi:hypothetical protein
LDWEKLVHLEDGGLRKRVGYEILDRELSYWRVTMVDKFNKLRDVNTLSLMKKSQCIRLPALWASLRIVVEIVWRGESLEILISYLLHHEVQHRT